MKQNRFIISLAAACLMATISSPVLAARPDDPAAFLQGPVLKEEDTSLAKFIVNYVDGAGYIVTSQEVSYSGEGVQTLDQNDLQFPAGYLPAEAWQSYQANPGQTLSVDLPVVPDDGTLAAIYAAQKSQNNSALTINYWLEDGTLINSQTFDYYRVSAGGIPVYTLGENYSINVPAGYTLITQAPDTVQVPALNRGVINFYVQPDGTNADGSAEALQAALNGTTYLGEQVSESIANALGRPELAGQTPLAGSSLSSPAGQTSASSQPSSSASSSASRSSSSQKSPDTGIALGTGGYIFSGSMGAIALSGLLLKNRRKG